jgi:hypothetical protein
MRVLWHIEPLLGKVLETENKTIAVAVQHRGKHAPTAIELTVGNGVFYVVHAEELS